MKSLIVLIVLLLICVSSAVLAEQTPFPQTQAIAQDSVTVADGGHSLKLPPGDHFANWTFMAIARDASGKPLAVFEDFSKQQGGMLLVDEREIGRSWPSPSNLLSPIPKPST
jgi:hypothetical protein